MAPTLYDDITKPGDLIEIDRGVYNHWAIYIGGNEVVHLSAPSDDLGSLANLGMVMDRSRTKVRRQKIWEVVRSDRYQINNLLDDEYTPRPRHVIVKEARCQVGRELTYCLVTYNCEHFVTELRYGKPESRQVKMAATIGVAAVATVGVIALVAALLSPGKDKHDDDHHRRHRH